MDFLINARLPVLDPALSGPAQSLVVEVIFWSTLYIIFANTFSHVIRALLRRTILWKRAKLRGGVFCGNGQDDAILLTLYGIHHFSAGFLMYKGVVNKDANIWRHGYLLENGFEIGDLFSLATKMYPYKKHDGMKDDMKAALVFHHLPGILLCGYVIEADLHYNEHLRAIGMWLLIGAFVSCAAGVATYALNVDRQMPLVALIVNANASFFCFCRMWIFPRESFALISTVRDDPAFEGTPILKLLYFAGSALSLFNIAVIADCIPKCIRYVKRAIDGKTPIEAEAVPRSRESILARPNRRVSSLAVAAEVISKATDRQRRSSLISALHLNSVEDTIAPRDNSAVGDQDDGLDDEDRKALETTLSKISDRSENSLNTDRPKTE